MQSRINVNSSNSKLVDGRLYITESKADAIYNTRLNNFVERDNFIIYPGMGKLVEYSGPYSRG